MKIEKKLVLGIVFLLSFVLISAHKNSLKKKGNHKKTEIEVTIPLSDDQIYSLFKHFPQVEGNERCLKSEKCAKYWMNKYNELLRVINEKFAFLQFQMLSNLTKENSDLFDAFQTIMNNFQKLSLPISKDFLRNCTFKDLELKRMFTLASFGVFFANEKDVKKLASLNSKLATIYANGKVCEKKTKVCLSMEPELTELFKTSRDYDKLLWAWKGWYDVTGRKMRKTFAETVDLNNKQAKESGYNDLSEYWLADFEDENFEKTVDDLMQEIKPLYQQLHAYVRRKLNQTYGSKYPPNHNPKLIPAHLLGNMWSQSWENIFDLVSPYPNVEEINVTEALINKGFTPIGIFKEAEKFYVSLGLSKMTPTFWKYSMIEKPNDRLVECHASATDYFNKFDFRIKMCTVVTDEYFYIVHHEMGHIEYYMQYDDQPTIFRNGANSGFHEAIGDTMALSVMTPKHLKSVGLIEDDSLSYEQDINFLMKMALQKVAFLPFGYLIDKWRWDVFRGRINETNYNEKWWKLIEDFQGLEPPVPRSENDFDPGAKYHVATYVPYIRYFVSFLHQFQFLKALCNLADQEGPLHKGDFYNSKKAGAKFKEMLELGASKHWTEALYLLTGEKTLNAKAINEYFQPLTDWLEAENKKYPNDPVGW